MPGDDKEEITKAILSFADAGADLIICTGGMSVDPDDRTPGGIRDTGAKIVTYGAPVLPGAMLLVAYLERNGRSIPVLGLPGCVMYAKRTVFDLILTRVMADDEIKACLLYTSIDWSKWQNRYVFTHIALSKVYFNDCGYATAAEVEHTGINRLIDKIQTLTIPARNKAAVYVSEDGSWAAASGKTIPLSVFRSLSLIHISTVYLPRPSIRPDGVLISSSFP